MTAVHQLVDILVMMFSKRHQWIVVDPVQLRWTRERECRYGQGSEAKESHGYLEWLSEETIGCGLVSGIVASESDIKG